MGLDDLVGGHAQVFVLGSDLGDLDVRAGNHGSGSRVVNVGLRGGASRLHVCDRMVPARVVRKSLHRLTLADSVRQSPRKYPSSRQLGAAATQL
jgi:hypothetical protein